MSEKNDSIEKTLKRVRFGGFDISGTQARFVIKNYGSRNVPEANFNEIDISALKDTICNKSELKLSNVIVDSIIGFCKPDRNDGYNTKIYEFLNGFSEDISKSRQSDIFSKRRYSSNKDRLDPFTESRTSIGGDNMSATQAYVMTHLNQSETSEEYYTYYKNIWDVIDALTSGKNIIKNKIIGDRNIHTILSSRENELHDENLADINLLLHMSNLANDSSEENPISKYLEDFYFVTEIDENVDNETSTYLDTIIDSNTKDHISYRDISYRAPSYPSSVNLIRRFKINNASLSIGNGKIPVTEEGTKIVGHDDILFYKLDHIISSYIEHDEDKISLKDLNYYNDEHFYKNYQIPIELYLDDIKSEYDSDSRSLSSDVLNVCFSYPTATILENNKRIKTSYFLYDKDYGLELDKENTENIMIGRNPNTINIFKSINSSLSNTVNIPLFLAYFNLTPYDVYDIGYKYEKYTSSSTQNVRDEYNNIFGYDRTYDSGKVSRESKYGYMAQSVKNFLDRSVYKSCIKVLDTANSKTRAVVVQPGGSSDDPLEDNEIALTVDNFITRKTQRIRFSEETQLKYFLVLQATGLGKAEDLEKLKLANEMFYAYQKNIKPRDGTVFLKNVIDMYVNMYHDNIFSGFVSKLKDMISTSEFEESNEYKSLEKISGLYDEYTSQDFRNYLQQLNGFCEEPVMKFLRGIKG